MSVLLETTPDGIHTYLDWVKDGLIWTLLLGLGGWIIALTVGTLVGIARTLNGRFWPTFGAAYVEIFRNIPLLVQMFFWYFIFPELVPTAFGDAIKRMPPPWASFVPALLCLGLYTATRVAEQIRAAIELQSAGQREAAFALGLSLPASYGLVILPQAFRTALPTLTSEFMAIFKNTSVALAIGLVELSATARAIGENTFRTFEAYGIVTIIYLVLALLVWALMTSIEEKLRIPTHAAKSK